jgi:hypothetical protein
VRILLTGASGVVATELAKKLRESNCIVVPLIRCSSTGKYLLNQNDLASIDLIIHAGLPGHPRTLKKRKDYISNTIDLFQTAKLSQTNLLFISSHSSRASNPTQYSRDKNLLERMALANNFSVLRIGVFVVSDDLKKSLVIRWLKLFGSSIVKYFLEILPSTNSENILSSIKLIRFHDHKIWDCFTLLSSKMASEGKEEILTISPCLRAINVVDFNQKKWLVSYVDLLNKLTFSFIDPLLNLLYDFKYYVK